MEVEKLKKAYDAVEMLKALNLPVSEEQMKGIVVLEKQYMEENVIPALKTEMTPFVSSLRSSFNVVIDYTPKEGITCGFENKQNVDSQMEGSSSRDLSKYSINGGQPLNKRRFVLAIVKNYVSDHPFVTFDELENRFPSSLSHSSLHGVVRKYEDIMEKIKSQPDLRKRFMLEKDEIVTLKNGTKVVVYNQWGHTFDRFLEVAKRLYNISIFS